MQRLALGLLTTCFGCNSIFGIKETIEWDAAPPVDGMPDAMWPGLILTSQVLESIGPEVIDFPPISQAMVQVGPIGQPLTQVTLDGAGKFLIPAELPLEYRLVVTVPGDVPTEIHWKHHTGHLVFQPAYSRQPQNTPPPPNSGVYFQQSVSMSHPNVITIGRWTQAYGNPDSSGMYFYLYSASAISLDGPLATLEGAKGDKEILLDADAVGASNGYTYGAATDLQKDTLSFVSVGWTPQSAANTSRLKSDSSLTGGPAFLRLSNDAVLSNHTPLFDTTHQNPQPSPNSGGVIPSDKMPNFIARNAGTLDNPMFLSLTTEQTLTPQSFANPFKSELPTLPTAAYRELYDYRIVNGVNLTSGFQVVATVPDGASTVTTIRFEAGIASNVKLGNVMLTSLPNGSSENKMISLNGQASLGLNFNADAPIDDCVVTLYRFGTNMLIPVRRFMMLEVPQSAAFQIDRTVFTPGEQYVLKIVCRKGFPMVGAVGDYTKVSYPFSVATLFPSTFTITN